MVVFFILTVLLFQNFTEAGAQTRKEVKFPENDSIVDEDAPQKNVGKWGMLVVGWSFPQDASSTDVKKALSYLQFDISDIPKSDLFNTVSIDSADLNFLVQAFWGKADRFLVTVNLCDDSNWSETEITWENRTCPDRNDIEGSDSVIVNKEDLPNVFTWDVATHVKESISKEQTKMTFVVTAFPLPDDVVYPEGIPPSRDDNLVWFWSKEMAKDFGNSAAPTLNIVHTTEASKLWNMIEFTLVVLIPTLSIIIPAALWIIRKGREKAQ